MKPRTMNNKAMQKSNFSLVLQTIFDRGALSRKQLADITGLTPSSVTNIVGRLLEDGYVVETGEGASDFGRKPIILRINPQKAYILGVEFNPEKIVGVCSDFSGNPVTVLSQRKSYSEHDTAQEIVSDVGEAVDLLLTRAGVGRDQVLGVGVMSSGPYDRERGIMFAPSNFKGWKTVPIRELLEKRLRMEVLFDRDSVGCTVAEWNSEQCSGYSNIVSILVNTVGIGGGMMIGGEVHYGQDNYALEIGHMTVEMDGPPCDCGDRGCLEAVATSEAVVRQVARKKRDAGELMPDEMLRLEDVIDGFRAGDAACVREMARSAKYVGLTVGNVIATISPECVVIGGSLIDQMPEYYDMVAAHVTGRHHMHGLTQIYPFTYGDAQSAMGAVKMVLRRFFESLGG